jgi:hypothetical protein
LFADGALQTFGHETTVARIGGMLFLLSSHHTFEFVRRVMMHSIGLKESWSHWIDIAVGPAGLASAIPTCGG